MVGVKHYGAVRLLVVDEGLSLYQLAGPISISP